MPRAIKEADWKVLKRLHPLALERLLLEDERIVAGNDNRMMSRIS